MAGTREHIARKLRALPLGGGVRVLAGFLLLAALLLATVLVVPIGSGPAAARGFAPTSDVHVVSEHGKAKPGCPRQSLPGQPSACASSGMPAATLASRLPTPAPSTQRSTIAGLRELSLVTQWFSGTPERPPRFVA